MLSQADNEDLCRTGPGTPTGNLLQRYWLPALLCNEIPEPDCAPVRVGGLGQLHSSKARVPENNFVGSNYARYLSPEFDGLIDATS